jgi:hypothetical protein
LPSLPSSTSSGGTARGINPILSKPEVTKTGSNVTANSQSSKPSKSLTTPSIKKQGMVLQKEKRARWRRRWMKLEKGKLYIFKNDIVLHSS